MAKKIYCFIMDDTVLEDIKKGNHDLAAEYVAHAEAYALPILDEQIDLISKEASGDADIDASADIVADLTDIIIDACAGDIERYR